MSDFLASIYPWIKALHVMAVISWMAGMLYLPRLFVYHVEADPKHINVEETLVKWEYLLLKRIINPAMIVTWVCGILLLLTPGIIDWSKGWVHVKVLFVILMSAYHGWASGQRKKLAAGERPYSGRTYRMLNEVPAVFMVIIVLMVIVRPF